ncbi:SET domain-containing protein [Ramaria rubella]|nr:SET domain-containing protein [Ramaria rubella]
MPYTQNILIRIFLAVVVTFIASRYYDNFRLARNASPFKLVNLTDRGKGLVATRDILQGELIFKETPLFIVRARTFEDLGSHIRSTVSGLNITSRSSFLELSHPLKYNSSDKLLAIFQTNSVKMRDDQMGVFPLTSRINHGCSKAFNSVNSWRGEEEILVVHALRHIKKGEEILREYVDTKRPRKTRQAELFEVYGFDCSCSVCSLSPGDADRSDTRLSSMATIQTRFGRWEESDVDGREAVRLAKRVWALGEKESYWGGRGRLAEDVVKIAAAHQNVKAAQQWADLAVEWYSYEFGYDSKEAERMRVLGSDPSKHPAWGTREELNVGGPDMILM